MSSPLANEISLSPISVTRKPRLEVKKRDSQMVNGRVVMGSVMIVNETEFFVEDLQMQVKDQSAFKGKQCGLCDKWIRSGRDFNRHLKNHQRPVHCPSESCSAQFAVMKDAWRHIDTYHSKEFGIMKDPIVCLECSTSFTRPEFLTRHKKLGRCRADRPMKVGPLKPGSPSLANTSNQNVTADSINVGHKPDSKESLPDSPGRTPRKLTKANIQEVEEKEETRWSRVIDQDEVSISSSEDGITEEILRQQLAEQIGPHPLNIRGRSQSKRARIDTRSQSGSPSLDRAREAVRIRGGSRSREQTKFSSTVLHVPDSTTAFITAKNGEVNGTGDLESSVEQRIRVVVPRNSIVKMAIDFIVE